MNAPLAIRSAYALPAFALAVVGVPVYVHLPKFYTDVVQIPVAVAGVVLMGARLFDAVTDPLIGYWSDHFRSRWGRRRPFILSGSWLLAGAIYFLFNPPLSDTFTEVAWFAAGLFLVFLFWTLVVVPYESLGPEITFDYNGRTTLFALRDGAFIVGTLVAAASPALVGTLFSLPETAAGERRRFFWISVIYSPMIIVTCLWCVRRVQEHAAASPQHQRKGRLPSLRRNRPFVILWSAFTINAVGSNLPATLILYYVQYVLESRHADLFLLLYLATGVAGMPVWVRLSGRYGKKPIWLTAMAVNTGAFAAVFFLGPGDASAFGVLVVLSGIGFGGAATLPSSIQADVIDYGELQTGQRQEGRYIGIWSISRKLAAALGTGLGLTLLGHSGYEPNMTQTETVRTALRVLYALVPSLCGIVSIVIASAFPIGGKIHSQILRGIQHRREGRPAWDPVAMQWITHDKGNDSWN